ncbi:SAPS-domain-containing protein [Coprinopsis marcescibilis]|uniref:SAPS-domain-containing protein n=1 Tax=Coprinopsis marcescibilis TaxID=230819 RepID=A0A5C3KSN6_COPMA|nr:SAPS-domain-containing protein [Coprinopsis marcescibilis]
MFWRFGFNNGSSIDSLLDKDDVALEALLDEDDLLQECKSQNTRLSEYLSRVDVLKKLLGYVTGQTESEEKGRFKYPYIATEVLCSDIWSIVETCVKEQEQLLVPFWETVLDRPPEEMKTQMVMASHFAKISSAFLTKKPTEMMVFIQQQPNIVERLLQHIETSPFVDVLVRIIQLDEHTAGNGVLEWLSSQDFIGRLVDLLSPQHSSAVHSIVTDLIKGIISMATPSPTAGLTDGGSNGPASNKFARELAKRETVSKLLSFMLYKFDSLKEDDSLPSRESTTSSVVHSISVVIELIRKNNSDYFEPYLFHTLRNRLIQVQQQVHGEDTRLAMEEAMNDMVNRMGVVHLGPVLELACQHLREFHQYLREPRSSQGPISTTVGSIMPLTLERYRILELLAELLHCSNMSLLNRPPQYSALYDPEGRLQGGLAALEGLAAVIALNSGSNDLRDADPMDDEEDEITPARDFPVRSISHDDSSLDSDDDMDEPGSSDDDMEEIAMYDEPPSVGLSEPSSSSSVSSSPSSLNQLGSQSNGWGGGSPMEEGGLISPSLLDNSDTASRRSLDRRSIGSRRSSRRRHGAEGSVDEILPLGEQLKKNFLDMNLFSTLLDLFFEFPWNNFLHSAVYDLIHQVLTGNVETGRNRELAISLFRDAKIMHRIVEGQARNDNDKSATKGGRLGYMGHLTLIAEDVITALEHFPPELRLAIIHYAPEDEWDQYVKGRYKETKANDTRLLGGGKPIVGSRNITQWKVDEDELANVAKDTAGVEAGGETAPGSTLKSEFKRAMSEGPSGHGPRNTAHFFPSSVDDDDDDDDDGDAEDDDEDEDSTRAAHFARYLEQEIHSSDQFNSSDEDDDDEGWLSQSAFGLREPSVSSPHSSTDRRPLGANGFEDSFSPSEVATGGLPRSMMDDDGFGPFADPPSSGTDPFGSFSSGGISEAEDMEDSFDFGDFQSAEAEAELEMTPTGANSWTFASDIRIDKSSESAFSGSPDDDDIFGSRSSLGSVGSVSPTPFEEAGGAPASATNPGVSLDKKGHDDLNQEQKKTTK